MTAEIIPDVLWAFRTTPRTSTLQSPFAMVYSAKVVLHMKRVVNFTRGMVSKEENNQVFTLKKKKDALDETKEKAT